MYEEYMRAAIDEARKAFDKDEVPVGAVIVKNNEIIARGHNLRETVKKATAHAEIIAIDEACSFLKGWRLFGCDLYVTLEPCPMCAGALVNARIDRVIFGAYDHKRGACGSIYNITDNEKMNHRLDIVGGVCEKECVELLQVFFKKKRETDKG